MLLVTLLKMVRVIFAAQDSTSVLNVMIFLVQFVKQVTSSTMVNVQLVTPDSHTATNAIRLRATVASTITSLKTILVSPVPADL